MKKIKFIFKVCLIGLFMESLSLAGPALSGERSFTQPDGTKFQGELKGDSSFHWIESKGEIVIYNPKDKYYYKASINAENKLQMSNEKPSTPSRVTAFGETRASQKELPLNAKKALETLREKSKVGNYPR